MCSFVFIFCLSVRLSILYQVHDLYNNNNVHSHRIWPSTHNKLTKSKTKQKIEVEIISRDAIKF